MKRTHHPDGTEVAAYYVRAVRTGPFVFVSGTTSLDPKGRVQGATAAEQTRVTLAKIEKALADAGASMADIVRLTTFVLDIADGPAVSAEIARVMTAPVASTLIGISGFVQPGLLVEIETTAVIANASPA